MTPENKNEILTNSAVHFPASFEDIMCGVLLKTPKSNAKIISIEIKNKNQTIIFL